MAYKLSTSLLALALTTGGALAQDRSDWVDPCEEYVIHQQLGSAFEGLYETICRGLGAQKMSPSCVDYWSAALDRGAGTHRISDDLLARYAARCEAAMPGGTGLRTCADGAPCNGLPVPVLAVPPLLPGDAGVECAGAECQAEPDEAPPCGGEGEPLCLAPDEPPPAAPVADLPDGGLDAADNGCGPGLECVTPPDEEAPCGGEGEPACPVAAPPDPAAQAGAVAADPALDLAFWQSIQAFDDPALYRAYLDRFPNGVFRPIAEARLAALSGATTPPATAATPPAPSAPALDPQTQVVQADAIMDQVYRGDPAGWSAAARPAVALYRQAADAGDPAALYALGELSELGIGMEVDNLAAIRDFIAAARAGHPMGWERALMLLAQIGDTTGFVSSFIEAYRADPVAALAAFDSSRVEAPGWVQQFLRGQRYYDGPIDGAFGPASQAALQAYVTGAPPPAPAATAPAQPATTTDLAAALQRELQRLGCYGGAIDGKWGPASAQAMENFNYWGGAHAPTDRPTEAGLAAARATAGQVCGVD